MERLSELNVSWRRWVKRRESSRDGTPETESIRAENKRSPTQRAEATDGGRLGTNEAVLSSFQIDFMLAAGEGSDALSRSKTGGRAIGEVEGAMCGRVMTLSEGIRRARRL